MQHSVCYGLTLFIEGPLKNGIRASIKTLCMQVLWENLILIFSARCQGIWEPVNPAEYYSVKDTLLNDSSKNKTDVMTISPSYTTCKFHNNVH